MTGLLIYAGFGTAIAYYLVPPLWHHLAAWPPRLRVTLMMPMAVAIIASWAFWVPFFILFTADDVEV